MLAALEIIPVIDLKGGRAVHARHGLRECYQPLATPLCPDGDPLALASTLLSLYRFRTIYIADLDALMAAGSNFGLIQDLVARFPETVFWIDQGPANLPSGEPAAFSWVTVLGSESLNDAILGALSVRRDEWILSLDFSASGLIGPKILLENDRLWPERIIVMNLARVGGEQGPEWGRLEFFRRRWPDRKFIAAGGVRNEHDLYRIHSSGFVGVLVATALHRGTLSATLIERWMTD